MDRLSHLPEAARSRIRTVIDRVPVQRRRQPAPDRRPPFWRFLDEVFGRELADVEQPLVVVISDRQQPKAADWVRAVRPQARLHELPGDLDPNRRHVLIAALGKCDVIVDERVRAGRYSDIPNLFFHLRVGGIMLLRRRGRGGQKGAPEAVAKDQEALGVDLAAIGRSWAARDYGLRLRPDGDEAQFGNAVSRLEIRDGHIMLVNRRWAQAKIRDGQIGTLLEARPELGRILTRREARTYRPARFDSSDPYHANPLVQDEYAVPELTCREYHDVTSAPGQLVTAGSLVLPETFRHIDRRRLGNQYLTEIAPRFGDATRPTWFTEEPPADGPRRLPGAYFYLDSEFRGHYGHMTTEVLSRFWAWKDAKQSYPELKAVMHLNKHRDLAGWEVELLGAAGLDRNDLVYTRDPVRLETMVSATPMFVNPSFADPDLVPLWAEVGRKLAAQSSVEVPERLFIGRRIPKRPCRNASAVEAFFTDLGFAVVYPEDHSLPDQVRMFRECKAIAGYAGSGMFNMMFAAPKPVILISSESYTGRNEFLISGIVGHDLHVAWCRSEATWDGRSFQRVPRKPIPMHAGFTFDFAAEGEFVRDVVAGLEA